MRARRIRLATFAALITASAAHAQPYPAKPVRIVVGFPAGGAVDILARSLGAQLSQAFGQQFVIDNRGGASSIIGADIAAKSPPDGYTLLMVSGAHAVNPSLYKKLPYDTERDFAPISLVAASSYILVVHPSLPVRSVRELITFAKQHRGQMNYASSGNGGLPHLSGELFKVKAGIEMTHIPYKGSAAVTTAVLAGQVPIMFSNLISTMPQVQAGKLRVIAVSSPRRLQGFAEAPTWKEQGINSEYASWRGMMGPRGMSAAQIAYWEDVFAKLTRTDEWRQDVEKNLWEVTYKGSRDTIREMEQRYDDFKRILVELELAK